MLKTFPPDSIFKVAHLLCISISERMLAHAFAWLKSTENIGK